MNALISALLLTSLISMFGLFIIVVLDSSDPFEGIGNPSLMRPCHISKPQLHLTCTEKRYEMLKYPWESSE